MILRSEALVRAPHLTRVQFLSHWREKHAPLVAGLARDLRIRGYRQVRAFVPEGEQEPAFDGFAQVFFDSIEDFRAMLASKEGRDAARLLAADEKLFLDRARCTVVWGSEHVII